MVIDASVAAAWYLPSQATVSAASLLLETEAYETVAPVVFDLEIRNVMLLAERRRTQSAADTEVKLRNILALVIVRAEPLRDVAVRCLPLARRSGLKLYDAIYLDLALAERRTLASRDGPLLRAAVRLGVDVYDARL